MAVQINTTNMNVTQHLVWHHQASLIPPNSDWLSASLYVVNLKKSLIMNMEESISTRSMFVNAKNDLLWIVLIHCRGLKDITCSISTFKGGKTTRPLAEVCTLSQLFPTVFKQRNPPFYSAWVTSDGFSSAKVKTTTPTIPRCLHLLSCFYWDPTYCAFNFPQPPLHPQPSLNLVPLSESILHICFSLFNIWWENDLTDADEAQHPIFPCHCPSSSSSPSLPDCRPMRLFEVSLLGNCH